MRTWLNFKGNWLIPFCVLATARAASVEPATAPGDVAAIQAIQQAPDPSAVVTAYANGIALARNDPKLYEVYVARMVDFGLPELSYHQAQTLTAMQSSNGLAWGVVAYVDARRGLMLEAISAINLAGQFAPGNRFVAHTAGELAAWYDLRADKSMLPDNAKDGLARIRGLLGRQTVFCDAYLAAYNAYQAQARPQPPRAPAAPAQAAPGLYAPAPQNPDAPVVPAAPVAPQAGPQVDVIAPLGYAPPAPAPAYDPAYDDAYYDWAPDNCYDWGPGWVEPTPWCWWQPCGFWGGCDFFPFGPVCLYGGFGGFHHLRHDGDSGQGGDFGRGDHGGRRGGVGRGGNPVVWHQDAHGGNSFFGTPARPSASVTQWARQSAQGPATLRAASTGLQSGSGAGRESWTPSASREVQSPYSEEGWRNSAPMNSVPRYHSGGSFFGVFRGGGTHGGGGSIGGGFHGGGFGGGGHGGGGHR